MTDTEFLALVTGLSSTQKSILKLLGRGYNIASIARNVGIENEIVRAAVLEIFDAVDASGRDCRKVRQEIVARWLRFESLWYVDANGSVQARELYEVRTRSRGSVCEPDPLLDLETTCSPQPNHIKRHDVVDVEAEVERILKNIRFSDRDMRVLRTLCAIQSLEEAAARLRISKDTLYTYRNNMFRYLKIEKLKLPLRIQILHELNARMQGPNPQSARPSTLHSARP